MYGELKTLWYCNKLLFFNKLWYKLLMIIPTITEFQGYYPEINKICVFYMDILSSNSAKTFVEHSFLLGNY